MILNLTQNKATPDQLVAGVADLSEVDREVLRQLLKFDELVTPDEIRNRAAAIAALAVARTPVPQKALIGGASFLMTALERELMEQGITPVYSFATKAAFMEF